MGFVSSHLEFLKSQHHLSTIPVTAVPVPFSTCPHPKSVTHPLLANAIKPCVGQLRGSRYPRTSPALPLSPPTLSSPLFLSSSPSPVPHLMYNIVSNMRKHASGILGRAGPHLGLEALSLSRARDLSLPRSLAPSLSHGRHRSRRTFSHSPIYVSPFSNTCVPSP